MNEFACWVDVDFNKQLWVRGNPVVSVSKVDPKDKYLPVRVIVEREDGSISAEWPEIGRLSTTGERYPTKPLDISKPIYVKNDVSLLDENFADDSFAGKEVYIDGSIFDEPTGKGVQCELVYDDTPCRNTILLKALTNEKPEEDKQEEEVVEHTMKELCDIVGYEFKLVKEEEDV